MLGTPLGGLFCELVGSPDHVISRGFRTKRAAPFFLRRKMVVCGPRYLSRIRDGGATFLERAREKRIFSTENHILPRNLSQIIPPALQP